MSYQVAIIIQAESDLRDIMSAGAANEDGVVIGGT